MKTPKCLVAAAVALLAGCVTDLGSSEQPLNQFGESPEGTRRCFHVVGDFTHVDPLPPLSADNLATDLRATAKLDAPVKVPTHVIKALLKDFRTTRMVDAPTAPLPRESELVDTNLLVTRVLDAAIANPNDVEAVFLAEYVVAQMNVEAGAPLSAADIDMFVAADEAVRTDDRRPYDQLIPMMQSFNRSLTFEVPCFVGTPDVSLDGI
jgi:hypothetical protein